MDDTQAKPWHCERCRERLGQALPSGELLLLATRVVMSNSTDDQTIVLCHCGWVNVWRWPEAPLPR